MTKKQWETINHFNAREKWGNPYAMDYRLIWLLDKVRKEIGEPFVIHCGHELDGHAPNSFHKKWRCVFLLQELCLYSYFLNISPLLQANTKTT